MSSVTKSATVEEWKRFSMDLLVSVGMFAAEAEISVDRMLDADLWKLELDGLMNLPYSIVAGVSGDMDVRAQLQILNETSALLMMHGHQAAGRLAATRAVESILKKIPEAGVVAVGVKNSQPLGSPAVFAAMLADAGYIGCCATNAGDSATKPFASSTVNFFGTNLMSWAYPVSDEDILLYSQGVHAEDRSAEHFLKLETKDLQQAYAALMMSTLAGPLQAGKFSLNKTKGQSLEQTQHFLLAIDPEQMGGKAKFQRELKASLDQLEAAGESTLKKNLRKTTKHRVLPETLTVTFTEAGWTTITRQLEKAKLTELQTA